MKTRDAAIADASAIARIYNEGIDDRVATFETRHRTADDVVQWLDGRHPVVVVEDDGGEVGWMTNASDGVRQPAA
ncbi:MAG TPA: hypothetical protein VF713_14785 [Thermoanaerobaculia bacterium]